MRITSPGHHVEERRCSRSLPCGCESELGTIMADDSVPEEIEEQCLQCHHSLAAIDKLLKPVLACSRSELEEKLDSLDAASLTLLLTYTMNSLFWVYLSTQGVNPRNHLIKRELERIQKAMQRAKTISTARRKGGGPRVNTEAAKRFVRSALWEEGGEGSKKRKSDGGTGYPGVAKVRKT